MDNPETQATLSTRDTGRRQTKHKDTTQHRKLKRWATRTPSKTGDDHRCSREQHGSPPKTGGDHRCSREQHGPHQKPAVTTGVREG